MAKIFEFKKAIRDYRAARKSFFSMKSFTVVLLLVLAVSFGYCIVEAMHSIDRAVVYERLSESH
ncbi:MAG: hypothetical protein R3C24_02440 [Cyanobacteriota/Melainabacteria group bacterium]|nr:hypothetical protein [Cyanobacteria bacterium HKST-UBA01]MCB9472079.1 hypothetical protein [Candidatus Obscuribacterales bacterium]